MEKPPWDAEPKIELGPALQQADALPTELRRTLLSYAAPCEKVCGEENNILYWAD
jgi:hypothetical protein